MTRIYLPATFDTLTALHSAGQVPAAGAHAVTPALRQWYEGVDEEDLEYVAFCNAAVDALPLLASGKVDPPRRAVVSADMPQESVEVDAASGSSAVTLRAPVALTKVAAIHVDGAPAREAVEAAAAALVRAGEDPAAAEKAMEEADDFELEWYDPTELAQLVAEA